MKRFVTALAIAAIFVAAAPIDAAVSYDWEGTSNGDWIPGSGNDNWTGVTAGDYPGMPSSSSDTATIADRAPQAAVTVDGLVIDLAAVTVDAATATGDMTLIIASGANIDVNGDVQLIGRTGADGLATFRYDAGTCTVQNFDLDGGDSAARAAVIDMNETLDLATSDSADIAAERYCDIDVAANKTFTVDDVTVTPGANAALMRHIGAGTFAMDVFTINGPTADDVSVEMDVASGATFQPNSLDLNGGGRKRAVLLDFNESVTVQNTGGNPTTNMETVAEGYVNIDVEAGDIFYPKDMEVDAEDAYAQINQKDGTGEVEATSLTITAGAAATSDAKYRLTAGTLDVQGDVVLTAHPNHDAQATIQIASGAADFTPDRIDAKGSTARARAAVIDADRWFNIAHGDTAWDFSVDGYVFVDLASGVNFFAGDVTFLNSSAYLDLKGLTSTGEMRVDAAYFIFNGATLKMTGPVRLKHSTTLFTG